MRKCPNCKSGIVDGGASKIIKKEFEQLHQERDSKIRVIDVGKDSKEVKEQKKSLIRTEYDAKIKVKNKEVPKRTAYCFYCKGTGMVKGYGGNKNE